MIHVKHLGLRSLHLQGREPRRGPGDQVVRRGCLAATSNGTVSFVENTNKTASEYVSQTASWVSLGGAVNGGIGAAAVG